ncbi:MAG: hypothetical protein ACLSWI_01625 [Candidatus Gastranaerophilaceae bacterium]
MISCCNKLFNSVFSRIIENKNNFYRRIEFGVCPICGNFKFRELKLINGNELIKQLSGKKAKSQLLKWEKKFNKITIGTKANQNVFYGDFKKTRKKDEFGNDIYLQLKKNFNNQTEVLGVVKTYIY